MITVRTGKACRVALFAAAAVISTASLAAETYPARPVRMIVPFPPAGGTDVVGRLIGQRLNEAWSVPVVFDDRPGAGSTAGTGMVAKATPDGYTIGVTSMSLAINATLYRALPYDPLKDLAPVILAARAPNVLVVHPSVPANTVKELIAYAHHARLPRLRTQSGRRRPGGGVEHE